MGGTTPLLKCYSVTTRVNTGDFGPPKCYNEVLQRVGKRYKRLRTAWEVKANGHFCGLTTGPFERRGWPLPGAAFGMRAEQRAGPAAGRLAVPVARASWLGEEFIRREGCRRSQY